MASSPEMAMEVQLVSPEEDPLYATARPSA